MKTLVAAAALSLAWAGSAGAAAPEQRPVVLELFTSQSCSSCPAADALLAELAAERRDVLALDLHVTYWDRLGWKDRFSTPAATDRQWAYARAFGNHQVYTPQMVIDGHSEAVGSDRSAVLEAIAAARSEAASAAPVPVRIAPRAAGLHVEVGAGHGAATVWLFGFDDRHLTPIGGGENRGRTLAEVDVVRSLTTIADWQGTPLALDVGRPLGEHAAVLLQAKDGRMLGVAAVPK